MTISTQKTTLSPDHIKEIRKSIDNFVATIEKGNIKTVPIVTVEYSLEGKVSIVVGKLAREYGIFYGFHRDQLLIFPEDNPLKPIPIKVNEIISKVREVNVEKSLEDE